MNTVEYFEDAPVGATATNTVGGRIMKVGENCWLLTTGHYLFDEEMGILDYKLDAPAPTTAREALGLAWELAHEVKPGQVIPKGAQYLEEYGCGLREYTAVFDTTVTPNVAPIVRTLEPLPEPEQEPEPGWLDAPAVIAVCNDTMDRSVFVREGDNWWVSGDYDAETRDLRDVTPLYPKGQETK